MKNLFILAIFCLFNSFQGYAQLSKGRILLGGSLSASVRDNQQSITNNQGPAVERTFSASPSAGIFISDRWVVGLAPSFSSNYQKLGIVAQESRQTNYGIGLFARYYRPVGEKFSFFGELTGLDVGFYRNELSSFIPQQPRGQSWNRGTYYRVGAFLGIGATYFVTPKIGIEASFGSLGVGLTHFSGEYRDSFNNRGDVSSDNKGFSFSLQPNTLNLGVSFYLGQ
jgi:hypothetical protein